MSHQTYLINQQLSYFIFSTPQNIYEFCVQNAKELLDFAEGSIKYLQKFIRYIRGQH